MTIVRSLRRGPTNRFRPGLLAVVTGLLVSACIVTGTARADAGTGPTSPGSPDSALAIDIARAGLEGITATRAGLALAVTYENRHFRHPATALGHVARLARDSEEPASSLWAIE